MMEKICSFRGKYSFLSNFSYSPIEYDGLTYPNAEAAFHAQKCADYEGRIKYTLIKNPVVAKRMGRREQLPSDWDDRAYDVMYGIVRSKFSSPELAEKLKATGDAFIEEENHWHDNRWGRCTCEECQGKESLNWLGNILMDVRRELNKT